VVSFDGPGKAVSVFVQIKPEDRIGDGDKIECADVDLPVSTERLDTLADLG